MSFIVRHPINTATAELMKGMAQLVVQDQLSLKDFGDQCHDLGFSAGQVSGVQIIAADVERITKGNEPR